MDSQRQETVKIIPLMVPSRLANVATSLHQEVFHDEFLTQLGRKFLRRYYRAFARSPYAVALAAVGPDGECLGALLGSVYPEKHYQYLIKHHGFALAVSVVVQALLHPTVGRNLVKTRLKRYILGVIRQFTGSRRKVTPTSREATLDNADPTTGSAHHHNSPIGQSDQPEEAKTVSNRPKVAELTHLFVNPRSRQNGIGSKLVLRYESLAREAGAKRIDLVTLPDDSGGAGGFYERLGWNYSSKLLSRSGEEFCLYQKTI